MYMKMGRPEKAKNLDKVVVEATIKCFEDLIKSALEAGGRSRFRTIKQIAGQAEMLIAMTGDRVADHGPARELPLMGNVIGAGPGYGGIYDGDGEDGYDDNVGQGVGALLQAPHLGQDDVIRQLIDGIGPLMNSLVGREKFEERKNNSLELNYLMDARERIVRLSGVLDKDTMLHQVDDRIRTILDKISKKDKEKENDDGVVPAKLLRGHQAPGLVGVDEGQGEAHDGDVGAPHAVGAEGSREPQGQGGDEELAAVVRED